MQNLQIELSEKDIERFWSKVDVRGEDECWEWVGANAMGYGQITIKNKHYGVHRVSWFLHNGEIPEHNSAHGMCVCHTCDNRKCVNPSHMFLGTQQENVKDMRDKGREAEGENHGSHKLTEKEVIEIREKYIPYKYTMRQLAKEYGVKTSAIHSVLHYETWKHVN